MNKLMEIFNNNSTKGKTMKINSLNRNNIKMVRNNLQNDLNQVGAKYGLSIELGSIRYSENDLTSKIKVVVLNGANSNDADKIYFENNCNRYGLNENDFDRAISLHDGTRCYICGIKPQNKKYPIIVKNEFNKKYKLSSYHVRECIKAQDKILKGNI